MAFENLRSTGIKYLLQKLKTVFLQISDAVRSVNGNLPDEYGDIAVNSVPYAQNLESDTVHRNYDEFIVRTSGGEGSVSDGDAWLMGIKGTNVHEGFIPESFTITTTSSAISVNDIAVNAATFKTQVSVSGTTVFTYTSSTWTPSLSTYGVTIGDGTPEENDTISVAYVKEDPGTIYVTTPYSFEATGWNLLEPEVETDTACAMLARYGFGYRIEGEYTDVKFSTTFSGTRVSVTVTDGNFNPFEGLADSIDSGYVWVTGYDATTCVYNTWEDWNEETDHPAVEAYATSSVDFHEIMASYFPNGLLKAGSVVDEINFNLKQAISRVNRMQNDSAGVNLAAARASGREYEYDTNYVYLARTPQEIADDYTFTITLGGGYQVNEHGIEFFTQTDIAPDTEIMYGNNLRNKLERDVLTISQQTLTTEQKEQVHENLGIAVANNLTTSDAGYVLDARQGKALNDSISNIGDVVTGSNTGTNVSDGAWADRSSMTLSAGKWIIYAHAAYSSSFEGVASIALGTGSSGSVSIINETICRTTGANGGGNSLTYVVNVSSSTKYWLRMYQNSGSQKAVQYVLLRAIRII